jgi:uncharacterized protein YggU (UPF0235/DUF167 family)
MRLRVLVKPGQRADGLWRAGATAGATADSGADATTGGTDAELVAHVRAAPKEGEANTYLERYLAGWLGVAPSLVRVVKGRTGRHKTVEVNVGDADEAAARLAVAALASERRV